MGVNATVLKWQCGLQRIPEHPELEDVCDVLTRRILGQTITSGEVIPPGGAIALRDLTGVGVSTALAGATFESVARRGKFLVFTLAFPRSPASPPPGDHIVIVVNPKLTGRLQLCEPKAKKAGPVHAVLIFRAGTSCAISTRRRWGRCS